jgi:hypothetical protein
MELARRPRTVTLRVAGSPEVLVPAQPPAPIPGGGEQSLVLVGSRERGTLGLLAWNNVEGNPRPQKIRLVPAHGSPGLDRIGLVVNSNKQSGNVRFLEGGPNLRAPAGTVRLRLETQADGIRLFDRYYDLEGGRDYTTVLLGDTENGGLRMRVLEDEIGVFTPPIAKIRLFHAVPGRQTLQLVVDGEIVDSNVNYDQRRKYAPLPAGPHAVEARAADTGETVVDFGTITGEPRGDLTLAAFTDEGGQTLGVSFDDPDVPGEPGSSRWRFLHLAGVADGVNVFLDDEPALEGIGPGEGSGYARIVSGSHRVRVDLADGTVLAGPRSFQFRNGEDFTVVFLGEEGGERPLALSRVEDDRE